MGRRQHWQDRTDPNGQVVRAIARYHDAATATEATARGQWMHTQLCRKYADVVQVPVSDVCDGLCMTRGFDPDEWVAQVRAIRGAA